MKRRLLIPLLAAAALALAPARAAADATAFFGISPTTAVRSANGLAVGIKVLRVGFEVEYAHITEGIASGTPGVASGMFNLMVATPTKTQVYLTGGGGLSHETLGAQGRWGVGTNIGGGLKLRLAGAVRLRIDYRVFTLYRTIPGASSKTQQRIYAGLNFSF